MAAHDRNELWTAQVRREFNGRIRGMNRRRNRTQAGEPRRSAEQDGMAVLFRELPLQSKSLRWLYVQCCFAQGSVSEQI